MILWENSLDETGNEAEHPTVETQKIGGPRRTTLSFFKLRGEIVPPTSAAAGHGNRGEDVYMKGSIGIRRAAAFVISLKLMGCALWHIVLSFVA